ncbi:WD40-repeat-containing domain protein, partial [Ephemerocybe angulata]
MASPNDILSDDLVHFLQGLRIAPEPVPQATRILDGHKSPVFTCAWSPIHPGLLATGSKDSEVVLWDTIGCTEARLGALSAARQRDITSLTWSADGSMLAAGCYDPVVRVFLANGTKWMENGTVHKDAIFSTRFSRSGDMLLTASLDGSACVWDLEHKTLYRQYTGTHQGGCTDVDWITDKIFSSSGADKRVLVMHVDHAVPLLVIRGHTEEANRIEASPDGTRVASCSNDATGRIWTIPSTDRGILPPVVLLGHVGKICAIKWGPVSGRRGCRYHSNMHRVSVDTTARVWDSVTGECLAKITDHGRPVWSLAFSPDGRFLATGGVDGRLNIFNLKTWSATWSWTPITSYSSGIMEIDWTIDNGCNLISLALSCGKVAVLDCTKVPDLE